MLWTFPKALLELAHENCHTKSQPAVGYFSLGENANAFFKAKIQATQSHYYCNVKCYSTQCMYVVHLHKHCMMFCFVYSSIYNGLLKTLLFLFS